MSSFKVGDQVRFLPGKCENHMVMYHNLDPNAVYTVMGISGDGSTIGITSERPAWFTYRFELATPPAPTTRKVRLVLTEKDIQTAAISDVHNCPLARAFKRQLKKGYSVIVGVTRFRIFKGESSTPVVEQQQTTYWNRLTESYGPNYKGGDQHLYVELPLEVLR